MNMKFKNIIFAGIIVICVFALTYGIYYQIFVKKEKELNKDNNPYAGMEEIDFDGLFDNQIHMQDYNAESFVNKLEPAKGLVFTNYHTTDIVARKI